jgi:hypothetical protein
MIIIFMAAYMGRISQRRIGKRLILSFKGIYYVRSASLLRNKAKRGRME